MATIATKPAWQTLTWHAARCQWKKYKAGRTYYLGTAGVKRTHRSHDAAVLEWRQIEADLQLDTAAAEAEHRKAELASEPVRIVAEKLGPEAALMVVEGLQDRSVQRTEITIPLDPEHGISVGIKGRELAQPRRKRVSKGSTVHDLIEAYLLAYVAQVRIGNRSRGRLDPLQRHLRIFEKWTPSGHSMSAGEESKNELNAAMLTGWHTHISERIAGGEIGAQYGHDLLGSVKQMIRWAWENEYCELPRNMGSRLLTIPIPRKKPQHISGDDLARLLEAASERSQLLILLALNAGMTAKDISDLHSDELDITTGTITRARSKTQKYDDVPTVTYLLWPRTLTLLKKFRRKGGERVLMTIHGEPMIREWIKENGDVAKVDSIRLAFGRVMNKLKKDSKGRPKATFKMLRATGANMIEQEGRFTGATSLYLGHSPRSMAQKHYVSADQNLLDRAVQWLGQELGV